MAGFGDPDGNYWLGLEKLHLLTGTGTRFKLRVEMESWLGESGWAEYSSFSVEGADTNFTLHVGGFIGTVFDSLTDHSNLPFSTMDRDHDLCGCDCAGDRAEGGGWWYRNCATTFPTAKYGSQSHRPYIKWYNAWGKRRHSLKTITMKVHIV